MAVNTKYQLAQYDMSKGMRAIRGPAVAQGMVPRFLKELTYEGGNSLVNRRATTSYLGVYSATNDLTADSNTDGDYYASAPVTNICSDGERIFGQVSLDIGQSNVATPGLGQASYVVELKTLSTGKAWTLTDIPAPRAAKKLASVGPQAALSFGSGANGELLLTNWGPDTINNSPEFFMVNTSGSTINDPSALKKTSVLTRFGNLSHTKVVGSGYSVSYDTTATAYRLLYHGDLVTRSWLLLTTAGAATKYHASNWDALMIGTSLYLILSGDGTDNDIFMYRYDMSASASFPSGGSLTSTSTNLNASTYDFINMAYTSPGNKDTVICLSISNQTSATTLRFAYVANIAAGSSNTVFYVERNATTLASSFSYSVVASNTTGDAQYVTCNGNIVLVEQMETESSEFTTSTASGIQKPQRNSCQVVAFVYASGSSLVEKSAFCVTGSNSYIADNSPTTGVDTFLNSHISSGGLVCVGESIYQIIEVPPASAGVQLISIRYICKAIDLPTNGALYGALVSTTASTPARVGNSLSRWVSERYVALGIGTTDYAIPQNDTNGAADGLSSGITSNESVAVFDIEPVQMTAVQTSDETTSFGHGWSISRDGKSAPSCCIARPVISGLSTGSSFLTANARASSAGWTTDETVTYRAVAVVSVGGRESYISSASDDILVAVGNIGKDIQFSVKYNGRLPGVKKIRIYRNRSSVDAANDYHFITEVDPPTGATASVTVTDYRMYAIDRPLDPTGGGLNTQGLFVAGQRDIANISNRNYIVAGEAVYPCQVVGGDDYLPTPMPDAAIKVPARFGRPLFVDSLADTPIVSTEYNILGIGGDPIDLTGQGALQGLYIISSSAPCNGKPCAVAGGVVVPCAGSLLLVDNSRNVEDISLSVSYFTGGEYELDGRIAYSEETSELFVRTTSSDYRWLVADIGNARWTAWNTNLSSSAVDSVATANRGGLAGTVAFGGTGGWVSLSSTSSSRVAPVITLGWDSFPDRFSVSNVRAIHVDGWATTGSASVSCASSFDLSTGTFTESAATATSGSSSTVSRSSAGYRVSLYPARAQGSSFRHVLTFGATDTLHIDTIAVEVQPSTSKYSSS